MSEPETRYTRASDGVRVAYQFIDGRDPVLLCSPAAGHQFGVIERIPAWREYREALRGDLAWAIPDFRGVGQSGPYEGPITLDDFVADLEAVADEIGDRELVLVAWQGVGTGPAVEFAARHPERVRCLLLHSPTWEVFPPVLLGALRADYEGAWRMAARANYDWSDDGRLEGMVHEWVRGLPEEVFWDHARAGEGWDFMPQLRALDVPVVIQADPEAREAASELAADLRRAVLNVEPVAMFSGDLGARTRRWIEPHLAETDDHRRRTPPVMRPSVLTERQLEVVGLVALGLSNAAIGERLGIAPGTVARHVGDILRRTELSNRTEVARWAGEQGLIQ